MKVAIVHYWLVSMRGGEKVLESLCELFPQADIFTHVFVPERISDTIRRHRVQETFIGRLPFAATRYQAYLPLMPLALEQLDLRGYDLVISSESGPAKGILTDPDTPHLCYCHSPMRYIWDMYHTYRERAGPLRRFVMPWLTHSLRQWDLASSFRVDHFVANSTFVASRIQKFYRRPSEVIAPPVATAAFAPAANVDDFYLMVGELVAYKRPDLAIDAFRRLGRRLVVIGGGEELSTLRARAPNNVEFLGPQPFQTLREHYARCRALIFPGMEDFGIVPVEAMASGRPVIAYGRGGALDTVVHGVTGILFNEQSVESLCTAVADFERSEANFSTEAIVGHAATFDAEVFREHMQASIDRLIG